MQIDFTEKQAARIEEVLAYYKSLGNVPAKIQSAEWVRAVVENVTAKVLAQKAEEQCRADFAPDLIVVEDSTSG